jgi:hypothetical protein
MHLRESFADFRKTSVAVGGFKARHELNACDSAIWFVAIQAMHIKFTELRMSFPTR